MKYTRVNIKPCQKEALEKMSMPLRTELRYALMSTVDTDTNVENPGSADEGPFIGQHIYIPEDYHAKIVLLSEKFGITVSSAVRRLIESYLERK